MPRKELTFGVIEVLKELIAKFQPELFQLVGEQLEGRERKLLDYIFATYYQEGKVMGRWYDPYHVLFSTCFALALERTDEKILPLIVPGIILHDIGYCALQDKTNLNNPWGRILHMQEGSAMAAKSLVLVGGYNPYEIGIIVEMDATHDNWILDIQTEDPDCLALIDADKIFVMSFISFYKDWVGGEGEGLSVEEFFDSRRRSFYEGKHSLSTKLAKQWRDKQFEARWQEIQSDILKDENSFRQYVEKHIRAELAAGRG